MTRSFRVTEAAAFLAITAVTCLLRFSVLDQVPPFVHGDEAYCGLGAIEVLRAHYRNLLELGWYHIPNLSYAQIAPFLSLWGENLYALRLSSAVLGVLCVWFLIGLGRALYGPRVGLIAGFLLAVSLPHIAYSRMGESYMQAATHTVGTMWAIVAVLRSRRPLALSAAGYLAGLGLYLYPAAQIAVPLSLVAVVANGRFAARVRPAATLRDLFWVCLGIAVAIAPMIIHQGGLRVWILNRTSQVVIWSNWQHVTAPYGGDRVVAVLQQIKRTLLIFVSEGDHNTQYAAPYPMVSHAELVLFLLGLGMLARRGFAAVLIGSWVLGVLAAAAITVDAPTYQRIVSLFAVVALVAAVGTDRLVEWTWTGGTLRRVAVVVAFAALGSAIAVFNCNRYFRDYAPMRDGDLHTEIARFVSTVPARHVVLDCSRFPADYATVRFLAPATRVDDRSRLSAEDTSGSSNEARAYVFCQENSAGLAEIMEQHPGGRLTRHLNRTGAVLFTSYLVPPGLERPQPRASTIAWPAWLGSLPPAEPLFRSFFLLMFALAGMNLARRLRQVMRRMPAADLSSRLRQVRRRMRAIERPRALAATALAMLTLLPFALPRDSIQLERRDRTWTLLINGVVHGTLVEPGSPFAIGRTALFLTGEPGMQRWSRVRLASGDLDESRWFIRDGLGEWSGTVPWKSDPLGARPSAAGEQLLTRPFRAAGDVSVRATLVAGSEGGIVLASEDGQTRLRLWMRPKRHNDADLAFTRAGAAAISVPVGPVGLELAHAARGLLSQTLPIVIVAAFVALPLGRVRQRRGLPTLPRVPLAAGLLICGVVTAIVVAATLFIERSVFESMPHVQDGVALIFQARNFALGRLASLSAVEPRFFDHEFILNNGRWFGKYPPGASLLYAAGLLGDALDWVNPLLTAGSLALLFALARKLYGGVEGIIAVVLAGTSPFLLLVAASYLSHPAALFFTLCFLMAIIGPARPFRYAVAGLAIGALGLTRPQTAVALAVPFLVVSVRRSLRSASKRRALIAFVAGALPSVVAFLAYNVALTGSAWITPFQLYSPYDRLGFGPVGVEWAGSFGLPKAIVNLQANVEALAGSASGAGIAFLALPLLPLLVGENRTRARLLVFPALATVSLFFFYFHDGIFLGPRYWYEAIPALFVLSARGLTLTARGLAALAPKRRQPWLAVAVAVILVGPLVFTSVRKVRHETALLHGLNGLQGNLLRAAQSIPEPAIVFVEAHNSWEPYGSVFWTLWPELDRNHVIYAREGGGYNVHPEAPSLPDERLISHFPGRRVYRWSHGELVPLASPPQAQVSGP